jgi:hypothetical protein
MKRIQFESQLNQLLERGLLFRQDTRSGSCSQANSKSSSSSRCSTCQRVQLTFFNLGGLSISPWTVNRSDYTAYQDFMGEVNLVISHSSSIELLVQNETTTTPVSALNCSLANFAYMWTVDTFFNFFQHITFEKGVKYSQEAAVCSFAFINARLENFGLDGQLSGQKCVAIRGPKPRRRVQHNKHSVSHIQGGRFFL